MKILEKLVTPTRRLGYFTSAILRELVPNQVWQMQKKKLYEDIALNGVDQAIIDRVNYYNKLGPGTILKNAPKLSEIPRHKSFYYYDLRKDVLSFDQNLRFHTLFGDINYVPNVPSILKSRPISADNANSVVLKLNRLRHFYFHKDPVPFAKKSPHAVWRGVVHNDMRKTLVSKYGKRTDHDIGHIGGRLAEGPSKGRLTIHEQLGYRFILSVEGNDVATNTKWIMGSNSVCLMPMPCFETWFMEGKLQPFVHFVPVAKDMSDLDERIAWCEDNPLEVRQIVANANEYVKIFADTKREYLITILVLQKYFERTGQIEPTAFSRDLFDLKNTNGEL